jgi:hypothetical protein
MSTETSLDEMWVIEDLMADPEF